MNEIEKARTALRKAIAKTRTAEDEVIGDISADLIAARIETLIEAKLKAAPPRPKALQAVAQVLAENSEYFNLSQNRDDLDLIPPANRGPAPNRRALEVAEEIIEALRHASG